MKRFSPFDWLKYFLILVAITILCFKVDNIECQKQRQIKQWLLSNQESIKRLLHYHKIQSVEALRPNYVSNGEKTSGDMLTSSSLIKSAKILRKSPITPPLTKRKALIQEKRPKKVLKSSTFRPTRQIWNALKRTKGRGIKQPPRIIKRLGPSSSLSKKYRQRTNRVNGQKKSNSIHTHSYSSLPNSHSTNRRQQFKTDSRVKRKVILQY